MNRCTAASRLAELERKARSLLQDKLDDGLLICDIFVCAALGYTAFILYSYLTSHQILYWTVGLLVWRQLILISVIAALVVRKADAQAGSLDDSKDFRTAVLSMLGRAACAGTLLLAIGSVTGDLRDLARLWLVAWAALFISWLCASRLLLLAGRRHLASRTGSRERIAIIGTHRSLAMLAARLAEEACITTLIDHSAIAGCALADALTNVISLARTGAVGLVVLATDGEQSPQARDHILDRLKAAPVRIALCAAPSDAVFGAGKRLLIGGIAMTLIAERPLSRADLCVKMLVDKLGAFLLVMFALPLLLAISLAIMLETGGPIIFSQRRNGWCGRLFTVYKFRTMRHAPAQHALHQTLRADPRCTRVGSFLRQTSLDELPQLWNVLRGEMSLVGPRPHADFMHARERASCGPVADYTQRQRVKPGLTGWAQVNGLRGAADTPEKLRQRVEFDRYYIDNWSIWLDLKILAQTPWVIFSRENAF